MPASTYTVGGSAWVETTGPTDKRSTRVAWRGDTVTVSDGDPRLARALAKGHLIKSGAEPERPPEPVDVEQFHTGQGWYTLPDGNKVRGEDAARAALADLDTEE